MRALKALIVLWVAGMMLQVAGPEEVFIWIVSGFLAWTIVDVLSNGNLS